MRLGKLKYIGVILLDMLLIGVLARPELAVPPKMATRKTMDVSCCGRAETVSTVCIKYIWCLNDKNSIHLFVNLSY